MNDAEREDWVLNDEGLYDLFQRWKRHTRRTSIRGFIRLNRPLIDRVAKKVTEGTERPSYLKYG